MKVLFECNWCSRLYAQESDLIRTTIREWDWEKVANGKRYFWHDREAAMCKECLATVKGGKYA